MTPSRPQWDDHLLAQLLDAALDAEHRPPVPPGTGGDVEELAELAGTLRVALPLPALPVGGRAEVRAAALAMRVARRPFRARLLVAAVITLLLGAVIGGALGNALKQPNRPRPGSPRSNWRTSHYTRPPRRFQPTSLPRLSQISTGRRRSSSPREGPLRS